MYEQTNTFEYFRNIISFNLIIKLYYKDNYFYLQMKKLRVREVKCHVQVKTTGQWEAEDLSFFFSSP